MAIAPQPAMPQPVAPMRPSAAARAAAASRHTVLSPVPVPRTGWVVTRLAALMLATSFAVGTVVALALAIATGTLTQIGQ
jgi:hypothetical protein